MNESCLWAVIGYSNRQWPETHGMNSYKIFIDDSKRKMLTPTPLRIPCALFEEKVEDKNPLNLDELETCQGRMEQNACKCAE